MSIRDLLRIVLPRSGVGGGLLVLAGYFDDSGTHDGSPVVVWGGVLGTESQWLSFEERWRDMLLAPVPGKPRLRMFHLSQCRALRGEFRAYSRTESDFLIGRCLSIISEVGLCTISVAGDVLARKRLLDHPVKEIVIGGSAEHACFKACLDRAVAWAELQKAEGKADEAQVALVFDAGREDLEVRKLVRQYRDFYGDRRIKSITFGAVEDFYPLQAADVVATHSFWHAQTWLRDGNTENGRADFLKFIKATWSFGAIQDEETLAADLARWDFS